MTTTNLEKKQIDLIKESISVYEKSMECRALFKGKELCFASIEEFVDDRGKSHLFRLKEMSHELFRNSTDATYKEKLYDITIGYTFHEAMKLRENLYQLEYYRPQRDMDLNTLTDQEKKVVHEIAMLVIKAETRLKEAFKEIKVLLNQLVGQLRDLIVLYKDNFLLPRFVFENEKALTRIYGRKGFENLLDMAYADGRELLIFKAAESYLKSQYFDTARLLFKKIMRTGSNSTGLQFLYLYASAYYFHLKNMFTRALQCAERARSLDIDESAHGTYMNSLEALISDITKEIKKKKK